MKLLLLLLSFIYTSSSIFAQRSNSSISIKLKNSSLIPKRVTVISYSPGEAGNGTQIFTLMPGSKQTLQFVTGTKLYIANSKQADSVMSGKRIDSGQPFLVVKASDNHMIFKL